jgi:hypothetical protein
MDKLQAYQLELQFRSRIYPPPHVFYPELTLQSWFLLWMPSNRRDLELQALMLEIK